MRKIYAKKTIKGILYDAKGQEERGENSKTIYENMTKRLERLVKENNYERVIWE
jgi:hypothetical protein